MIASLAKLRFGSSRPEKMTEYLLSANHPYGRSKARFFRHFGFRPEEPDVLRNALLVHAQDNPVATQEATSFGHKYIVDGPMASPDGRNPVIRSVWIVETGHSHPRFVTEHPAEGSQQ